MSRAATPSIQTLVAGQGLRIRLRSRRLREFPAKVRGETVDCLMWRSSLARQTMTRTPEAWRHIAWGEAPRREPQAEPQVNQAFQNRHAPEDYT